MHADDMFMLIFYSSFLLGLPSEFQRRLSFADASQIVSEPPDMTLQYRFMSMTSPYKERYSYIFNIVLVAKISLHILL